METTRQAPRARTQPVTTPMMPGFEPCACCGTATKPDEFVFAEEGQICLVCHADRDAADTLQRGTRQLATSILFVPGFVGLALLLLEPLANLFTPHPGVLLAAIPAIMTGSGVWAIYTAATVPDQETGDRTRLAAAGVINALILGGLAFLLATAG